MEAGRRTGAVVLHVGLSCRIGAVCTRAGTAAERPGQTGSSEEQLRIVTTISSGCCGIEYGNSYRVGWDAVIHEKNKSPDADISPKPTVFLPSIAEIKVQKAGTYLCLLEDFFPDIIKIDWQEKDDKTILTSQQGDTMKTKGAYMKFSWLTVAGASLDKEHKCIVKHESDRTKVNQEILFPSINKDLMAAMESEGDSQGHSETKQNTDVVTVSPLSSGSFSPIPSAVEPATNSTKDSLTDENAILQLQLTNTSAYYTYVLLLLKSLVYSAIMAVCLLGRPALYGNGKSS